MTDEEKKIIEDEEQKKIKFSKPDSFAFRAKYSQDRRKRRKKRNLEEI